MRVETWLLCFAMAGWLSGQSSKPRTQQEFERYVQAETITLSDEFGAMTRALGSMLMGINPEKSLRHSLISMRESILNPALQITPPAQGTPACGPAAGR